MSFRSATSGKRLPAVFVWAAALCTLLLIAIATISDMLPDSGQRAVFSDLNPPVIDLLASAFLLLAALQTARRSKRLALAWGALALAEFLYGIGDIIWATLDAYLHQSPFPSAADVLYLLFYPVSLIAILLFLKSRRTIGVDTSDALDLAVIVTAAILGFGNYLIGPIIQNNIDAPPVERFLLVAYPVGDLLLLGALLLLIYHDPYDYRSAGKVTLQPEKAEQPAIPMYLLAAGFFMMIITDSIYGFESLRGTYASGDPVDMGWVAASLLIAMAGAAQWSALRPGNPISAYQPGPRFQRGAYNIKVYLPYFWLLCAFALLIRAATAPVPMGFTAVVIGVTAILVFVLFRQFIALSDNRQLTARLHQQATSLETINRELNAEMAERMRIEEKLAFDVLHDQMTGLANRRLFLDRLGQAIKRCNRHDGMCFGVLFLDLDQFKLVNDSLGHAYGDQLLILVGRRLVENLRAGDTVARFGGDEFAILLDDLQDEESTRAIAEKLLHVIEVPLRVGDRDIHVTASIGIATDLVKYDQAEDLLRDVDLAMYQAKATGKSRYVMFRSEMREMAFSRLVLEGELRQALQKGEFQLFYQPISSLDSDRVVAVEALLRWFHPIKGILAPADFLAVAEASDLILSIGDWVLRQACTQLAHWQKQYPQLADLAVNINLSDREFAQPHLAGKIFRALEVSGLDGSCLRLEITERVLVENYPIANATIAALNKMGVRVEVDDFGTGYSALAYLQQFPINAIKIDKSFISEMQRNPKGLGLVRAIVSMARELGMETIAEGIETGEQLSELKSLLCGFGQGYLLSKPLDAARAETVLSGAAA
ncbi:MAG TPA: EAL domain-containing protein [Anaerolineales bacterium]|nr:EAL domain-containing protein [Anaerolineales bacterium]